MCEGKLTACGRCIYMSVGWNWVGGSNFICRGNRKAERYFSFYSGEWKYARSLCIDVNKDGHCEFFEEKK